ncbi:MAG: AtpZ/AtpI family protein [Rhodospirillales bacterium]|jgi:ATP synthase protein I|nr:AtpZ/AtpI family protein [Rhodospirillales bacterium]MBT4006648.1 AtpZ/AtpI family protein [Rhodospirillales bacterium]MBT5076223.1 AtpZ/AtpI family protein [Rhodospirillales bacterium]MBT5113926.1 AtpZ/AtpI family protein [Rhodospirillales bacterium]MBT5672454.1 AtpZ/AtpI family protein [Rhodospirillales bacterium]
MRNQDPSGGVPLKTRLSQARSRQREHDDGPSGRVNFGGAAVVLRTGIELAGTMVVGVGIGWSLDRWLETTPWFLVLFFFMGGAAGVLNVYRAVRNLGLAVGYNGGENKNTPDDQ